MKFEIEIEIEIENDNNVAPLRVGRTRQSHEEIGNCIQQIASLRSQ